jgi:PAP2 superfamily
VVGALSGPLWLNRSVAGASERAGGRPVSPAALARRLRDRRQQLWLALDLLIVAWLCWLFDAINSLAPVRQALAERNGAGVLDLERSLSLDPERALDAWLARQNTLSQVVVFWYENVHIAVTLAVFAWLWWRRDDLLGVMRWTLVIVNLIALAVFWTFPVAPPRMLSGAYVDLVARVEHLPVWQVGATALNSNQLCSLPSLHIAWATWCSIAVWHMTQRRWLRAIAVVYPLLTTFAVMATGNHFLTDAVAGAGVTGAVFFALTRTPIRGWLGWPARVVGETGAA